jgi:hypothetical protein
MKHILVPLPHLLVAIVLGGASRIVVDASAAAVPPPPPTAEVVVDDHDERPRRLRAPLDNRTISFACFVSIVADYGNDGEVGEADDGVGVDDDHRTSTHPVVWCDVRGLPPGRNVTAEIRGGACGSFVDVASSGYYTSGVASPFYLPVLSDEEKAMGVFDHEYCCRVDVLSSAAHDDADDNEGGTRTGGGGGKAVSVLSGWHDMDVTYNYRDEGGADRNDLDEDEGHVGGDMEEEEEELGVKAVKEVLSSVYLTDENTRSERVVEDLNIVLAALAGVVITMALVSIIYGSGRITKKGGGNTGPSSSLRRRGRHGRHLLDDDADYSDAEAVADTEDEDNAMVPPARKENEIV